MGREGGIWQGALVRGVGWLRGLWAEGGDTGQRVGTLGRGGRWAEGVIGLRERSDRLAASVASRAVQQLVKIITKHAII